jgi:pimeloyl-ACP methyl ester carboxylesterase
MAARDIPDDHPAFRDLPVTMVTVDGADDRVAVNVSGRLASGRMPVVCIPGYQHNMADYAALLALFREIAGEDWPVVLLDLRGRGRSSDRQRAEDYATPNDARDLDRVLTALGIEAAAMIGQGYGGQVIMMLAASRPRLIGASVLIDAGPVSDPRGLVRLRTNLRELETLSGEASFRRIARQILSVDYPEASDDKLDAAALRTHFIDKKGKVVPLFDKRLVSLLDPFDLDDVLVPQWPLFKALSHAPMLLMRSQFTEQLRRSVFEEMLSVRRDTEGFEIEVQGSPALLDSADDVGPIADFIKDVTKWRGGFISPPEVAA